MYYQSGSEPFKVQREFDTENRTINNLYLEMDDTLKYSIFTRYDKQGNVIELQELDKNGDIEEITKYEYDSNGDKIKTIFYNPTGDSVVVDH